MREILVIISELEERPLVRLGTALLIVFVFWMLSSPISFSVIKMIKIGEKAPKAIKNSSFYAPLKIFLKVLGIYFVSIILLALLFSGLLLSVTIFSKNLKEAQNSLYPLELLVAFVSMLPMFGITGSLKSSLIPFVNIALLFNVIVITPSS